MIKSITVTEPKGKTLKLELSHPEKSGLIVESIDGFGPSQANINSFSSAVMDGEIFSSARMTKKNIIIDLIMMDLPSVEENRLKTYTFFPIKKKVKLTFETDIQTKWCEGYVERNEPQVFSDQEGSQISIICTTPYFFTDGENNEVFSGVHSLFEFPFSNESTTLSMIEFGNIMVNTRTEFEYVGDIDNGMLIHIFCKSLSSDLTIYNVITAEKMKINFNMLTIVLKSSIEENDEIIISTVAGQKYARLLRNGMYTNIISAIEKDSDWLELSPGKNVFDFETQNKTDSVIIRFEYNTVYGGI